MVNFNSLSEAEKFVFAKEFLTKFKVIKKLKPSLTDDKDIIMLVARKFYDDDAKGLLDCVKFIDSKTDLQSLETADLDDAVDEYKQSLSAGVAKKEQELHEQEDIAKKSDKEYDACVKSRNKSKKNVDDAENKIRDHKIRKTIFWTLLIVGGFFAVGALGGVVPIINSILAWCTDLVFHQVLALVALGFGGFKAGGWLIPKLKARISAKADGRKNDLEKANAEFKEKEAAVQKSKQNKAAAESQKAQLETTLQGLKDKEASEISRLSNYTKMGRFDRSLEIASIALREYAARAGQKDSVDVEDWHRHFEASLYAGVYMGRIRSQADIDELVGEAKEKFETLSSPLAINSEYTEKNIKSRTGARTNQTLEEIFEAI